MELIIALLIILVLVMIGLVVGKPSECYECGHRFTEGNIQWNNSEGKIVCYGCYSKNDKGEKY